jgi:flagellar hook-associated protein 2
MATTTSGAIHFSGLGNGVDFSSIIDAVITANSVQKNRLTKWKQEWTDKQDSLQDLNKKLLSLQTTLKSLDTMDEFFSKNASTSDTTLVTATATSEADNASHSLEVNQLAQSDVWVADTGEALSTTDITGSTNQTLGFTYSNANISLSVAAGTTLDGLIYQINNDSSTSKLVRASKVYDGSTYHLQLTGRDTGANRAIGLTAGFGHYTPTSFTNTRKAQDAQIRVDNYPPSSQDVWRDQNAEADPTADITGGTTRSFTFSCGDTNVALNVAAGTSLQGLVNQINGNTTAAALVTASVVTDEDGSHLELTSKGKGAANLIKLTGGFGNYAPAAFENTTPGQTWLSRATNSITDAVSGFTLNLVKATDAGDPVTFSSTTNTAKTQTNITTFVDQMNEVLTAVQTLTKVSTSSNKTSASILTGNYGVQDLVGSKLKNQLLDMGLGFRNADATTGQGDLYTTLSQVGITFDSDSSSETNGLLVVDSTKLGNLLASNASSVAKLFSAVNEGDTDTANFSFASCIAGVSKPGSYKVEYTLWPGGVESATINGHKAIVSKDGKSITGAAGYPEAGITINVTNRSGFRGSGTVYLKQGKIGELVDSLKEMTNTTNGPLHILDDNYQDIVDNIDKKIANEEKRLDLKKQNLTAQYAKLDALLGKYQNLQTSLASQISQLSSS